VPAGGSVGADGAMLSVGAGKGGASSTSASGSGGAEGATLSVGAGRGGAAEALEEGTIALSVAGGGEPAREVPKSMGPGIGRV
jgi:hypothetical protein